ncbi:MAG: ABC transporter permease [Mangrovicoccus sp.]|nr:ABC transporter permease [Mangrovicoccus sp.]
MPAGGPRERWGSCCSGPRWRRSCWRRGWSRWTGCSVGTDGVGPARTRRIRSLPRFWIHLLGLCVLLFLVGPAVLVIPMSVSGGTGLAFPPQDLSLRWYRDLFASREWQLSAWVSLRAALLTAIVATPLGTAAAYGLRTGGTPLARLVLLVLLTPLIFPAVILAVGIFYLYARLGLLNTTPGLVLAHSMLAIPVVVLTVAAGLQRFDMAQERAARTLGASRLTAFLTVILPQIRASVLTGAVLAFVVSLDEVVIALFIATGAGSTLTRRMFTGLRDEIDPTIAAVSTLVILITLLLVAVSRFLGWKR